MTGEVKRLLRRPRRSKLVRVDLTNVKSPEFNLDNLSSSDSSESSNEIDLSDSSDRIRLPLINAALRKSTETEKHLRFESSKNNDTSTSSDITTTVTETTTEDLIKSEYATTDKTSKIQSTTGRPLVASSKYKLDNNKSVRSNYSTRSLVQPYKPLGPDPLPFRPVKRHQEDLMLRKLYYNSMGNDMDHLVENGDQFALNDFLVNPNEKSEYVMDCSTHSSYVSTHTYNQICKILEEKIRREANQHTENIHVQTLMPDITPFEHRRPMRQIVVEMAYYLKKELAEKTGSNFKTKINPLPKWKAKTGVHTELVIYEDKEAKDEEKEEEEEEVTPAQMAIVDSLLGDGTIFNLKAAFVDTLPDLAPIRFTLTYINLSYNHFEQVPDELFDLAQLQVIKMRNNPVKGLPDRMCVLTNLRLLDFSYCKIKEWPACIYELENLQYLDFSYNQLNRVEDMIAKLSCLKVLSLEGNEIECLPCSMLRMSQLESLNVKNNYLHPLIWRKMVTNQLQSLVEISAATFLRHFELNSPEFYRLSEKVQKILRENLTRCDCCSSRIFGQGLKIIKPVDKVFGAKYVPFLFNSCSPECLHMFKKQSEF